MQHVGRDCPRPPGPRKGPVNSTTAPTRISGWEGPRNSGRAPPLARRLLPTHFRGTGCSWFFSERSRELVGGGVTDIYHRGNSEEALPGAGKSGTSRGDRYVASKSWVSSTRFSRITRRKGKTRKGWKRCGNNQSTKDKQNLSTTSTSLSNREDSVFSNNSTHHTRRPFLLHFLTLRPTRIAPACGDRDTNRP